MESNPSTKKITKSLPTGRRKKLLIGVGITIILILSPFAFYLYRYAPHDSKEWDVLFFTVYSGGFNSVQLFIHALFTKLLYVLLTGIWFLTARHWWKYAILVPFTMFLFQLSGVINFSIQYIDEYDFWYSLPVVIPVIIFLVWLSGKLRFYTTALDIREQIDEELESIRKENQ